MLVLARKLNESIMVGNDIEISILEIKGDQVKLGINAPSNVKVYRQEVYAAIQDENKLAANSLWNSTLPIIPGSIPSSGSSDSSEN